MPLRPVPSSPRQLCPRTALVASAIAIAIAITISGVANLPPASSTTALWWSPGSPGIQSTLAVAVAVGDRTPRATHQSRARTHLHACFNDSGILTLNIATDRSPASSPPRVSCPFLSCPLLGFGPFFLGFGEAVAWGFSPQMDPGEKLCRVLPNLPANRPPPISATAVGTSRPTETDESDAHGDCWGGRLGWGSGAPR